MTSNSRDRLSYLIGNGCIGISAKITLADHCICCRGFAFIHNYNILTYLRMSWEELKVTECRNTGR